MSQNGEPKTAFDALNVPDAPLRTRKPRRSRAEKPVFETDGPEILTRLIRGVYGKRRARTARQIAKWLGLARHGASVSHWKTKTSRPGLAHVLCLYALFPNDLPPHVWLTKEELALLAEASLQGRILAAEPAPNPKTPSRRRRKGSEKQVTLEEVLARGQPPKEPEPAPPPAEVPLPAGRDELMDWPEETSA